MSVNDEITRLSKAKSDIASAISSKGVSVPSDSSISDYAALVSSISGSGGGCAFYITLTKDSEGNCTTDKTFDEVLTAYNEGKSLYMIYEDYILPVTQNFNSFLFYFGGTFDISGTTNPPTTSVRFIQAYIYTGGVGVSWENGSMFVDQRQRNTAEGFAGLDENSKISVTQIPDEIARMEDVNTAIQSAIGNALGGSY